jgi:hypothetical protein
MPEEILPGVYIEVRPEALIVPGPVTVGNIGIVGTARPPEGEDEDAIAPPREVKVIGSYAEAKEQFGPYRAYDPATDDPTALVRALELAYGHGASTVFAVRAPDTGDFTEGLALLLNENVHIVVVAGADAETAGAALTTHCTTASTDLMKRERIAVVGSRPKADDEDASEFLDAIKGHTLASDRVILVAPGIKTTDAAKAAAGEEDTSVILPGGYAAAAIAGMLSARSAHVSLTNKPLAVSGLEVKFSGAQLEQLVDLSARVLALEERRGIRVVKAITTSTNTAWHQITTRRIVDFAKFGVRSAAGPYIGLLNNDRVRKALKGSINGFLASMVDDEMLISYELDVTATREEEIRGIAKVTMTVRPTFSIDFIKVVMFLG